MRWTDPNPRLLGRHHTCRQEAEGLQGLSDHQGFQVLLDLQVRLEEQASQDPLDKRETEVYQEKSVSLGLLVHRVLQG